VFRNASRTHLTPKLRALAHYPPVSLTLPQTLPGSTGWVPVEWWFDRAKGDAGSANDSPQASADQPGTEGD
jgi:hypothetical protein